MGTGNPVCSVSGEFLERRFLVGEVVEIFNMQLY
jgi:hypothetical protein